MTYYANATSGQAFSTTAPGAIVQTWTCPKAGNYCILGQLIGQTQMGVSSTVYCRLYKDDALASSAYNSTLAPSTVGDVFIQVDISTILSLAQGDVLTLRAVNRVAPSTTSNNRSSLTVFRVG